MAAGNALLEAEERRPQIGHQKPVKDHLLSILIEDHEAILEIPVVLHVLVEVVGRLVELVHIEEQHIALVDLLEGHCLGRLREVAEAEDEATAHLSSVVPAQRGLDLVLRPGPQEVAPRRVLRDDGEVLRVVAAAVAAPVPDLEPREGGFASDVVVIKGAPRREHEQNPGLQTLSRKETIIVI